MSRGSAADDPHGGAARVAPSCRHFGRCGGCSQLHRGIDEQLDGKRSAVLAAAGDRFADLDLILDPPRSVPRHTRIKLLYPAAPDAAGELRFGLYERGSHNLIGIRECRLQDRALTKFARRAEAELRSLDLQPWDERRQTGFVRALWARIMPGTGELLLGIVTREGEFPAAAATAAALQQAAHGLRDPRGRLLRTVGVVRNIQPGTGNALLGPRSVPLRGREYQTDRAGGLSIRVSFGSFYQSHRASDAILYRPAMAMLGDVREQRVVDAYGGVGAFALRLAAAGAARIDLVESSPSACRDAERNAAANDLADRIEVHRAEFSSWEGDGECDLAIVDPPRKGLEPDGVARLAALAPSRMLYVSCAPAALARDLDALAAHGYRPTAARLVDLFPHTEHVETVVLLHRGRQAGAQPGA